VTARSKVLAGLGVLAVAGLVAAAFVLWPRGTTEVSEQEAVEDFRARDLSSTTAAPSSPRTVPEPGVYTYAAEGEETVKLGPLPAATRPLPTKVTAVAVDAGESCFDWTINLFAEHTEDTRWCTDPALRLDGHPSTSRSACCRRRRSWSATRTRCPTRPGTGLLDRAVVHTEMTGGPASITATLRVTHHRREDSHRHRRRQVAVTPINLHYAVTGDLTGTWDETTWWTTEHLPVRIERTLDLSGPATFSETSKLQLISLTPAS
jgi:hypothetical protein